ncbi:MAG TPA: cytochrome c [Rhodanobacteraceae bacterium]|nr:cytochrome c [Rhodanobacteraceae bacterium]
MKRFTIPLLVLTATLALPVFAQGDAARGKIKAKTCFACHGVDGKSIAPQYPKLAGQYADYIVQVLKEYKDGQRSNPIMKGFAAPLSEQDMEDIAAYFSSLPPVLDDLHHHIQGAD